MAFSYVSDEPAHENKLVLGETNKIYVDDSINNGLDYYVAIVPFEVTEAGRYSFVNASGMALVYDVNVNNLCGFTGTADLEVGTYYIWISAYTTLTTGMFDVTVTKVDVTDDPVDPPVEPELPALILGENTVVIDGSVTNLTGNAIAWLELVVETAGSYKVSSADLNCYIYSEMNLASAEACLCSWTGIANLEPGTYYVCVGKEGVTGEFTVSVETDVEAPAKNTIVVGENTYILNDALKAVGYEWLYLTVEKDGIYTISGLSTLNIYIWPDYPNQATVPETAAFVWNVDAITGELLDTIEVELTAGTYLVGFRYNFAESGEYHFTITYSEKVEEPAPDVTPDTEQPAPEKPSEPAPELTLVEKLVKALKEFIAIITDWFKSIFAGAKK